MSSFLFGIKVHVKHKARLYMCANICIEDFLTSPIEFAQAAYKLIDSKLCLDFSTVVLAHILNHHVLESQDSTELLVSYSLLLYAGKDEPRWLDFILLESIQKKRNRVFCKIMTEFRLGFYDSFKLLSAAFSLLFEMCKLAKLDQEDLDLINGSMVNQWLDLVEETRGDAQESFNYDVIRIILVLNEQYMMSGINQNLVLDMLQQRIGTSDTLSANLIFMLNRSNDACVQLLILKLLYGIFTRPVLYEYFYTNDLYVLVDITLRELCNLGDTKESQNLRDAYLRVFEPLLENTQLRAQPYKKQETYKVLVSLLNPIMGKKVNSTTKRLVRRIIENWWEKICGGSLPPYFNNQTSSPNLLNTTALSSSSSCSSGPTTPPDTINLVDHAVVTRKEVHKKLQEQESNRLL
ncbi:hypothetical protein EDC96DRAFT_274102 [Choanephora cucurbitarum]|nr:hypothetical protein EDC96DRAFT_274102 [Choanephora cucurbitarum]